jgi:esterase/lipase
MGKQELLILHGAIGASDQLIPLAEELADDFDVYLFEFSGHGQTPFSVNGFSIPVFAEEAAIYIENNFSNGINVFGYSMGGYVALYMCMHYPGTIQSLCTLGTKWKWTPEIAAREVKMLDAAKIQEKIPAFAHVLQQRHEVNGWEKVLRKTANMMMEMGTHPPVTPQMVTGVKQRVQILLGDSDEMVTREETEEIFTVLPHAGFTLLEGTKHPIEKVNISLLANNLRGFFQNSKA